MKDNMILVKSLTKQFKVGATLVRALDNVNLELEKGQMIALRGPSGCGKSTLLNMLGSLDHPTSGVIEFNGINVAALSGKDEVEYRRSMVGFIFQSFNLVPYLKAIENVMLPMEFTSLSLHQRENRGNELLLRVGIEEDRQHHRPSRLSGGQQQRVAVARALANSPKLLLADEPTANLDSSTGEQILNLLVELASSGQTVIVATHDSDIASLANTIIDLQDGKVIKVS